MPKTRKNGQPIEQELPSTLQRSDDKAQRTFAKAHDSAAEQYGDERRAHQVAFAALKHTHEKIGDHWEPKDHKGPSDKQAEGGRDTNEPTAGGVDANASKAHLLDVARRLEIAGRSSMTKEQLVAAELCDRRLEGVDLVRLSEGPEDADRPTTFASASAPAAAAPAATTATAFLTAEAGGGEERGGHDEHEPRTTTEEFHCGTSRRSWGSLTILLSSPWRSTVVSGWVGGLAHFGTNV